MRSCASPALQRTPRCPAYRSTACRAAADADASALLPAPPSAPRVPAERGPPGRVRRDDWAWLEDGQRTNRAVLEHLRAENRFTTEALAGTWKLQEELHHTLSAQQWHHVCQGQAHGGGDSSGGCPPDCLAGAAAPPPPTPSLHGCIIGAHVYCMRPACGAAAQHTALWRCGLPHAGGGDAAARAAAAASLVAECERCTGAADAGSGGGGGALPPPWQRVLHGTARAAASPDPAHYELCSLLPSPDGDHIAVVERVGSSSGGGSARVLTVLHAATQQPAAPPLPGADGPMVWCAPAPSGSATASMGALQGCSLYAVVNGGEGVSHLQLPLGSGSASGGATAAASWARVHTEAQGAGCSLLSAPACRGGLIVSTAADGAAIALRCVCGGAAPPAALALPHCAQDEAAAGIGARAAVAVWGAALVVRHWSATAPNGAVSIATSAADALHADGSSTAASALRPAWQLLIGQQPDSRLEAVFLPPQPEWRHCAPAAPAAPQLPPHLVTLVSLLSPEGEPVGLEARRYELQLGGGTGGATAAALLLCSCRLPLGVPYWELEGAEWMDSVQQLRVEYSSLTLPPTRVVFSLPAAAGAEGPDAPPGVAAAPEGAAAPALLPLPPPAPAFDPSRYSASTTHAACADGCLIPISLAASRERCPALPPARPAAKLLLRVYGCYGLRDPVGFDDATAEAMDAGWVVAVAHVRGGGWLGAAWAEAGRGSGKACSVRDVLACAHHLTTAGYVAPGAIAIEGASAGAWLAAAALLHQPAAFAAAVLTVPLLDLLTALEEGRLGAGEWGDVPATPAAAAAVVALSPYDLLGGADPGALRHVRWLVRAALEDAELPWWEGPKFMARLRHRLAQGRGGGSGERALLWVRRGGHGCFRGSPRDEAMKLAFLEAAAAAAAAAAPETGAPAASARAAACGGSASAPAAAALGTRAQGREPQRQVTAAPAAPACAPPTPSDSRSDPQW